jgi:hypothetical protein
MWPWRLVTCTSPTQTPTAEVECDPFGLPSIEVDGSYFPGWDFCHRSALPKHCGQLDWWEGKGCPSFAETALYYFSLSGSLAPAAIANTGDTTALRCRDEYGTTYDVVWYLPTSDVREGELAVFDTSGQMRSFISMEWGGHLDTKCCEGHEVQGWSWGERIYAFCKNEIAYSPDDFTDSSDTATP